MSNISLQTFNANFMTQIRGLEYGHTDETGTYDFGVGFNVVCNNNNRVMYFESHLSSNVLPSNYTNNDIVNVAWSNVLPNVKTWATDVVNSSNILGVSFVPSVATNSNLDFTTTSNFHYNTFSSNFDVKVHRMNTYPENNPSCWCVGFNVFKKDDPSNNLLIDTQVVVNTLAVYRAEQEILDLGWSNLKETIGQWASNVYSVNPLLNTNYTASNW